MIAGLAAAQVESQNIVGYQKLTAPGKFYSSGSTFISVGSTNTTWKLGDVTASGMDPTLDLIQFLDTSTANAGVKATYIDLATSIAYAGNASLVGWWNLDLDTSLNSTSFPAGSAFLGNFSSPSVTITFPSAVN